MSERQKTPARRLTLAALVTASLIASAMPPASADVDPDSARPVTSAEQMQYFDPRVPPAVVGDGIVFSMHGGPGGIGIEPGFSDGTAEGTIALRDIVPGGETSDSNPTAFTAFADGQRALFLADDGAHGFEPWITDGTSAGTTMLADLRPGTEGIIDPAVEEATEFVAFGDKIVMSTYGLAGSQLWITDGTEDGTESIAEFDFGRPAFLTPFGDKLAFRVASPGFGLEPWVTDGTAAGTALLADISPGPSSGGPSPFVPFGDRVLFTDNSRLGDGEPTLYISNGTPGHADVLATGADIPGYMPFSDSSFAFDDVVLFAVTVDGSWQLWQSDGTPDGTGPFATAKLNAAIFFRKIDDQAVMYGADDAHGSEVWRTDGTAEGTVRVTDINPGPSGSFAPFPPSQMISGEVMFLASSGPGTWDLWATDGYGARIVYDAPDGSDALPETPVAANGHLFFALHGQLWAISDVPDPPTESQCADLSPTVEGTDADDVLFGTNGPDIIFGYGGDDRIYGLGGDDILCGGPGNDRIFGGAGNNTLIGGDGIDKMRAGAGNDVLVGGNNTDFLKGGPGDDWINGGAGDDRIRGSNGDDNIVGGAGNDRLWGGPGDDTIDAGAGDDVMKGSDGIDTCDGGPGADAAHPTCETITL